MTPELWTNLRYSIHFENIQTNKCTVHEEGIYKLMKFIERNYRNG